MLFAYQIKIDTLIESLNSLWYKFSEHFCKWSYKKLWDTITITSFNWNDNYKISFWWDKIDEININQIRWEMQSDFKKIEKITIWKNIPILEGAENKSTTTLLEILNERNDIFVVLDMIDFTFWYENIVSSLTKFSTFDYLWNKSLSVSDLEIDKPKIDNVDNLLSLLWEKKYTTKYIFTKKDTCWTDFISVYVVSQVPSPLSFNCTISPFIDKFALVIEDVYSCILTIIPSLPQLELLFGVGDMYNINDLFKIGAGSSPYPVLQTV